MSISMYKASVPVFTRVLSNLQNVLKKGEAFADAKKVDHSVLLNCRLAPDMFPLTRQVQIACDAAKGCGARLAGVEVPKHEDVETSFAQLYARIGKVLDFLKTLKPEQIDGSEDKTVTLPSPGGPMQFKGLDYLLYMATANLHFHSTTAYDILRHNGVEVGKMDYLGPR
jgi:uncharacterized protein